MDWNLHLTRLVIEDGSREFLLGDVFDWEVVFWFEDVLNRSTEKTKTVFPMEKGYYHVNAEVIYISRDPEHEFCILDFGIAAVSETATLLRTPLPPSCQEGDYVGGKIRLELPFCTEFHPYNIRRRWRVNRITADLATFSYHPGDLGTTEYREIQAIGAVWAGSYILHCSDLGLVPDTDSKNLSNG